jgi:hypothetical protein
MIYTIEEFKNYFESLKEKNYKRYKIYDEDEIKHKKNLYNVLLDISGSFVHVASFIRKFGYDDSTIEIVEKCFQYFFDDFLKGYSFKIRNIEAVMSTGLIIMFYTNTECDNVATSNLRFSRYFDLLKLIEIKDDFDKLGEFKDNMENERTQRLEAFKKGEK